MKDAKKRKPFKTLAEDLKVVRHRPLTSEQVAGLNKVFDKDVESENQRPGESQPDKKIAISPESEVEA